MVLILPCLDLLRTVQGQSASRTNLPRAPVIDIVCLCVLYLHLKDTLFAPSILLRARPLKLRRLLNKPLWNSHGNLQYVYACPLWGSGGVVDNFASSTLACVEGRCYE